MERVSQRLRNGRSISTVVKTKIEAIISFLIDCWKDLKSEDLTELILYAIREGKCFTISPKVNLQLLRQQKS
jgi:hypothetical protein